MGPAPRYYAQASKFDILLFFVWQATYRENIPFRAYATDFYAFLGAYLE